MAALALYGAVLLLVLGIGFVSGVLYAVSEAQKES